GRSRDQASPGPDGSGTTLRSLSTDAMSRGRPMPTKVKDAEIVALADAMLRELETLRQRGDGAYPPRLRHLAALAAGSATDAQAQKAAAKKAFTANAVATEKAD